MSRALQNLLHLRWMIKTDIDACLEIESHSFADPWKRDDFVNCLRHHNNIALVAEYYNHDTVLEPKHLPKTVVGFAFYEISKSRFEILNLAVHEDWRYKGVAAALVTKLQKTLVDSGRHHISILILETNVAAQLFLRAMGFKCVRTHRDYYQSTDRDAYEFRFFNRERPAAVAVNGRSEEEERCDDERGA